MAADHPLRAIRRLSTTPCGLSGELEALYSHLGRPSIPPERLLQASAASYVVSPAAVSASAADPDANADHLSAGYLVALAGRLVREVGALARRAGASGKRLPTLTIDTQIGFRSAADRAAFADDLTAAVLDLAARYHHDDGRPHRLVVAAHPLPEESA